MNHFMLLDVIYTEFIGLSTYYGKTQPNFYIEKRFENNQKLIELRLIDDTIAKVMYDLDRNQTFAKTKTETIVILDNAVKLLNSKKELKNNILFKSKLFTLVSQLFLSKKDFVSLESFCINTYNEFIKKDFFSKNNHEIKLQMLRYICNALFINNKHKLALEYIHQFHEAMKEFKQEYYAKNIFFYFNALANNYSVINPEKAIETLNEAKKTAAIINHPSHLGYVFINLAGAYFDLKQFKLGLKNILNLYTHPLFENLDNSLKLHIHLFEIILRIETKQFEFVTKALKELKKNNFQLLRTEEHLEDLDFIKLLEKLLLQEFKIKTVAITLLITNFCKKENSLASNSIVNYKKWLLEKTKSV